MKETKNSTKIIIALLIIIILLLTGFIIFFAEEVLEERRSFKTIYKNEIITNNQNNNNNANNNSSTNDNYISREDALRIALENVSTNKENTYDIDIELDYKYGKTVYEVSFNYQQYEFEYYIDAENGSIIKSFRERD